MIAIASNQERADEVLVPEDGCGGRGDDGPEQRARMLVVHWPDFQSDLNPRAVEPNFFRVDVDDFGEVIAMRDARIAVDAR